MKKKNVVLRFEIEKSIDTGNRNKLIGAKIIIIPHPFFANEVRNANARQGRIKQGLNVVSAGIKDCKHQSKAGKVEKGFR